MTDEPLYTRCPLCKGSQLMSTHSTFAALGLPDTDQGNYRCPCARSQHPGYASIGLTLEQVEDAFRKLNQIDRHLEDAGHVVQLVTSAKGGVN